MTEAMGSRRPCIRSWGGAVQELRGKVAASQSSSTDLLHKAQDICAEAEERASVADRRADKGEARAARAEGDAKEARAEAKRLGADLKVRPCSCAWLG